MFGPTSVACDVDGIELQIHRDQEQLVEMEPDEWEGLRASVELSLPDDHARVDDVEDGTWSLEGKFFEMRLAVGLWEQVGPFAPAGAGAVPVEVATSGKPAIASYLYLAPDRRGMSTRAAVAEKMGLASKQSVSNYLGQVRWSS